MFENYKLSHKNDNFLSMIPRKPEWGSGNVLTSQVEGKLCNKSPHQISFS